jgi:hypothetical protein
MAGSFILGFGSTEQAFEDAEEKAIREHIETRYAALGLSYFTDEFVAEIREWLNERAAAYRARADEYKSAEEYPDRYSSYYPTILDDASHIAVILRAIHINRRHALSPDGWAAMRTRPVFVFDNLDMPAIEQAA